MADIGSGITPLPALVYMYAVFPTCNQLGGNLYLQVVESVTESKLKTCATLTFLLRSY